jgi:hypothetical protein
MNRLGPNFTWHFSTEDDRKWLTEAITDTTYANASLAISLNQDLNENDDRFKMSRIASDNDGNRILWVSQRVVRPKQTLTILAIAIHPSFRSQNYIRRIADEEFSWLKSENRWNVKYLEWPTSLNYISGNNLFGWQNIPIEDSVLSRVKINDLIILQ